MIEYKIKDIALDPLNSVIVKTGGEVEFTMQKIDNDIAYLKKAEKEVEGQVGISSATMENIKRTHPHIADMNSEDLTASYLYREAMGIFNVGTEKLKEIKKQLDDYSKEKVEIIKQTNLPINETNMDTENIEEVVPQTIGDESSEEKVEEKEVGSVE